MFGIRKILQESKTRYLQAFENKKVPVDRDRTIISITFDDVPHSAMTNGVPLLDRFNIKATFYVAIGLARQSTKDLDKGMSEHDSFMTPDEIHELGLRGHDIGCHTYSHYMLSDGTAQEMALDAKRNVQTLCELLDVASIEHFSYPFGQVNFKAKRLLGKSYKSMRSSRPGINQLSVDMYLLRAISVYNDTFDKGYLQHAIDKVENSGGWLIFYTHGVTDNPGAYSCTPEQFSWLLERCASSMAEVLPVSEAYTAITT